MKDADLPRHKLDLAGFLQDLAIGVPEKRARETWGIGKNWRSEVVRHHTMLPPSLLGKLSVNQQVEYALHNVSEFFWRYTPSTITRELVLVHAMHLGLTFSICAPADAVTINFVNKMRRKYSDD